MEQRYQNFRRDVATKKLFSEFQKLRAWHFRYILGSWHSDADLAWQGAQSFQGPWGKTSPDFQCADVCSAGRVIMSSVSIGSPMRLGDLPEWSSTSSRTQLGQEMAAGSHLELLCFSQDNGVSVHDGLRFYDGQIATMPVILEYGGSERLHRVALRSCSACVEGC